MINQSGEISVMPHLTCDSSGCCQGKKPIAWLHANHMMASLNEIMEYSKVCIDITLAKLASEVREGGGLKYLIKINLTDTAAS